MRKKKNKIIIQ